jgi:hypothetical protein
MPAQVRLQVRQEMETHVGYVRASPVHLAGTGVPGQLGYPAHADAGGVGDVLVGPPFVAERLDGTQPDYC